MSSRHEQHEGVSCDCCMKNNFAGRRYKCLVCFDFDLCAECYDTGQGSNEQHSLDHSVQCILTRSDFEIYYGNESVSPEVAQALSCPYCRQLGLTESTLHEHLVAEHADATDNSYDVVCPVCAVTPNGEPNRMVNDLIGHLALEHIGRREGNELSQGQRRLARGRQTAIRGGGGRGRLLMEGGRGGAALTLSREAVSSDPITAHAFAELLSQLGGMRRTSNSYSSTLAQIQQLQQQLGRGGGAARRAMVATLPRESSGGQAAAARERTYADALWQELESSARQTIGSMQGETNAGTVISLGPHPSSSTMTNEAQSLLLPRLSKEMSKAKDPETELSEYRERSRFVEDLFLASLEDEFLQIDVTNNANEAMSKTPSFASSWPESGECTGSPYVDIDGCIKPSPFVNEIPVSKDALSTAQTTSKSDQNSASKTGDSNGAIFQGNNELNQASRTHDGVTLQEPSALSAQPQATGGETFNRSSASGTTSTNGPRIRKVIISCACDQ